MNTMPVKTTTIDRELYKELKRKASYYDALVNALDDIHFDRYYQDRDNCQPCSAGEFMILGCEAAKQLGYQI